MSNSSRAAARVRQARKKTRFDTWSCWHARSCKFFSMLWPSGHHLRSGRISAAAGKHDIDTLNLCTLTVTNHRKSSRVIFCFPKNLENIGPPWVSNPFIHWLWPGYGHFNRETDEEAKRPQVLHGRVIGQNEAVTAVAKAVRRARAGLKPDSTEAGDITWCTLW